MKGFGGQGQFEDARPDEELINGFLAGNANDFNVLYERYKRLLYGYLHKLLPGRHAQVDDVFQQTWAKAVEQLGKYQNRQKFPAWLMRIAHNLAMDQFRAAKCAGEMEMLDEHADSLLKEDSEAWRSLDAAELGAALDYALERLTPELREVFLLRQEEVPFKEIAEMQGCSINTALSRMQYALKNLRTLMAEWNTKGEAK